MHMLSGDGSLAAQSAVEPPDSVEKSFAQLRVALESDLPFDFPSEGSHQITPKRSIISSALPSNLAVPGVLRRPSVSSVRSLLSQCSRSFSGFSPVAHKVNATTQFIWSSLEDPDSSKVAFWYITLMPWIIMFFVLVPLGHALDPPPLGGTTALGVELVFDIFFMLEILLRFFAYPSTCLFFQNSYNVIDVVAGALPLILRMTL
jgi:hypothetical protein